MPASRKSADEPVPQRIVEPMSVAMASCAAVRGRTLIDLAFELIARESG